ncbi:MAG: SRPBCC family protein [Burkholderiales bacterium]|nr:SRPBCC family protein [Burkholderiales bacterium]
MRRRVFIFLVSWFALTSAHAEEVSPNTVDVNVKRIQRNEQSMFELHASGLLTAAPERVWKVLTDYNRYTDFVPNLQACRVLSRNGNEVIIDQTGSTSFLFFSKSIHIVVRAVETPTTRIDVNLVSGDMKHYVVRWELIPENLNGTSVTRLVYTAALEPDFFVPPLFGSSIAQADVKKMMQAVVAEVLKAP